MGLFPLFYDAMLYFLVIIIDAFLGDLIALLVEDYEVFG